MKACKFMLSQELLLELMGFQKDVVVFDATLNKDNGAIVLSITGSREDIPKVAEGAEIPMVRVTATKERVSVKIEAL